MVENDFALDTKARDAPKALAPIQRESVQSVQSTVANTDDHERKKEEWVASTGGAFLGVLKMVYLYGVFTGVHHT